MRHNKHLTQASVKPLPPVLPAETPLLAGWGAWLVLGLTLLAAALVRWQFVEVPLERDEGEFAYAGQLLLQGIPPFRLAYNMKFPGTYLSYGLIMALFGQTVSGIRIGLLFVNAATTTLMFLLGRRLAGPLAGAGAAAIFGILSAGSSCLGPFGHATHFVLLPALAGILLLQNGLEKRGDWAFFGAGMGFGLAILMKQPGAVFAIFGIGWWGWTRLVREKDRGAETWREGAILLAGLLFPLLLTGIWLVWAGVFDRFRFWVFDYARAYIGQIPWFLAIKVLRKIMKELTLQAFLPWGLAALGLVLLALDRRLRSLAPFVLALLVCSFVGVCPGFYFRSHYFILLLPALGLLAGIGLVGLARLLPGNRILKTALPLLLLAAAFLQPIYAQRNLLFGSSPESIVRTIFTGNPFNESVEIARYIREHTSPEDRIAVVGSEPQIYFYADRKSATGYIYTYGLMERHPFARSMQEEMARQIEQTRPKFIVYVNVFGSWLRGYYSDGWIMEWAIRYIGDHYVPVAIADMIAPDYTEYRWGVQSAAQPPKSASSLVLFQRR